MSCLKLMLYWACSGNSRRRNSLNQNKEDHSFSQVVEEVLLTRKNRMFKNQRKKSGFYKVKMFSAVNVRCA